MDMYEFNRQFQGSADETQDYKMKNVHHMYPQMAMPNLMPANIIPVPMMAFRPGAEMEYNRWLNSNYHQQYRNGYYEAPPFSQSARPFEPRLSQDSMQDYYQDEADDMSPECNGPGSPRFGPGPPIVTSDRVKGPHGCNLFVFHLPNEITNWDLYLLFRKYGTILSVHTMINKATGLSKGYGFVSYSARDEARLAISSMDGYRLGKKRLKVQVKRSQEDANDHDEFDEAIFDTATGENSGITTRASTPHGLHSQSLHHSRNASMSMDERGESGSASAEGGRDGDDENDSGESGESATTAADASGGSDNHCGQKLIDKEQRTLKLHSGKCAHKQLADCVASMSLTAVTPEEAEANVKNSCAHSAVRLCIQPLQSLHQNHTAGRSLLHDHAKTQCTGPSGTNSSCGSNASAGGEGSGQA